MSTEPFTLPNGVTIRPLDLDSDADVQAVDDLFAEQHQLEFGASARLTVEQYRSLLRPTPYKRADRFVAELDGAIVAVLALQYPLQDNLDSINLGVQVSPKVRGRGIGTALVEFAKPLIAASGRSLVSTWANLGPDEDPKDPGTPTAKLAARLNLTVRNVGIARAADLPIDPELLQRLLDEATEKMAGYQIITWLDRTPEEHLVAYGRLLTQMFHDEPDEDVEQEVVEQTPERIRHDEERILAAGDRTLVAVAIAPDGSMAAQSAVEFRDGAELTWQENTLVMPEHRGHRLGLALKATTHAMLPEVAPSAIRVVTYNSHVNPWMIAINERLGYQIRGKEAAYQGRPNL